MHTPQFQDDVDFGRFRDGYPALASWITHDPDSEPLIFRKFGKLAARSVLHQQAHLVALEHELDQLDTDAQSSPDFEAQQSLRRWETLMRLSKDASRSEQKHVEKLKEIRISLTEYYEILILQSQTAHLRKPNTRPLLAIRKFLGGKLSQTGLAKAMPLIAGRAEAYLDDESDLVALASPTEDDYLSRILQNHWFFRTRETLDPLDRTTIHKNSHVVRTVAALAMTLAAALLIGAIVTLYLVPSPKAKSGLVAMYTMLFALSVALCTNARRAEVFAATAAYAAVLVVFVSGDLGGTKAEQCLIQLEGAIWKTVKCPG